MTGKIVKRWILKAPCWSVNKAFLLFVKKGIKQLFEKNVSLVLSCVCI